MRTPPALQKLRPRIKMLVRSRNRARTEDLLMEVRKWKEVQRPYRVADDADNVRAPGWDFVGMLDFKISGVIREAQRSLGRVTTGVGRRYVQPVGATLRELDAAISYWQEHMAGHQARLQRLLMIREVAVEFSAEVITQEIVDEADRRLASGNN